MLIIHCADRDEAVHWQPSQPLPERGLWFDLCRPTDEERACIERMTGLPLPDREALGALGLAQRNRDDERVLHLQILLADAGQTDSPLGLALGEKFLISLRYADSAVVDAAAAQWRRPGRSATAASAFAMLMEEAINHVAGEMQKIAGDLARLSAEVFSDTRRRTPALHQLMVRTGRLEGRLARFRPFLLGFARSIGFVNGRAPDWLSKAERSRLQVIGNDLRTLEEFDDQLTEKLQFLLDAILGFISTAQNMVMKLLTVASVATIPPIILAGIWGMNFQHMPELEQPWAYPAALALLLLSMLLPLAWFRARGWMSRD